MANSTSITETTYSCNHHTHAGYVMNFFEGSFDESVDEYFLRIGDGERFAFADVSELITDTVDAQLLRAELVDFFTERNSNEWNLIQAFVNENSEIVIRLIRA